MASLSEDLRLLADLEDDHKLSAAPLTAEDVKAIDLGKINWQRLICFAIPAFNMVAPIWGLPPLPVPAFCATPTPTPEPSPVG